MTDFSTIPSTIFESFSLLASPGAQADEILNCEWVHCIQTPRVLPQVRKCLSGFKQKNKSLNFYWESHWTPGKLSTVSLTLKFIEIRQKLMLLREKAALLELQLDSFQNKFVQGFICTLGNLSLLWLPKGFLTLQSKVQLTPIWDEPI